MTIASPPPTNNLLSQLDDIKGHHPVSAWPLATGWWVVMALVSFGVALSFIFYLRRRSWKQSWRNDAAQSLAALNASLGDQNAQAVAATLSESLRRIAVRKYARTDCAGLQGETWLLWLKSHDPKKFDWSAHGQILTQMPYARPGSALSTQQVRKLIDAAQKWVV